MSKLSRELVAGIIAAVVLVGLPPLLQAPLWLAVVSAFGTYIGLRLLIRVRLEPDEIMVAEGVSQAQFDEFRDNGHGQLAMIRAAAERMAKPEIRQRVETLCSNVETVLRQFEKQPAKATSASLFLPVLSKLAAHLDRYAELSSQPVKTGQLEESLTATEAMIREHAIPTFERLYARMLTEDGRELRDEARKLERVLTKHVS